MQAVVTTSAVNTRLLQGSVWTCLAKVVFADLARGGSGGADNGRLDSMLLYNHIVKLVHSIVVGP